MELHTTNIRIHWTRFKYDIWWAWGQPPSRSDFFLFTWLRVPRRRLRFEWKTQAGWLAGWPRAHHVSYDDGSQWNFGIFLNNIILRVTFKLYALRAHTGPRLRAIITALRSTQPQLQKTLQIQSLWQEKHPNQHCTGSFEKGHAKHNKKKPLPGNRWTLRPSLFFSQIDF